MTDVRNIITNDKVKNTRFDGHSSNPWLPQDVFVRNSPAGAGVQTYTPPEGAVAFYLICSVGCRITLDGTIPTANQGLAFVANSRMAPIRITPGAEVKVYQPASNAVLLQWLSST